MLQNQRGTATILFSTTERFGEKVDAESQYFTYGPPAAMQLVRLREAFYEEEVGSRYLKPNAVPTLCLELLSAAFPVLNLGNGIDDGDHEHYAQVTRAYQRNALKTDGIIRERRTEIASMTSKYNSLEKRSISKMILNTTGSYTEEEKNFGSECKLYVYKSLQFHEG
ncbi:unnamed protein product [Ceratitis capitata]|uniref:(Mediterranean fruit fly) hypothetical protein n=1 Tax=Ceratitis capitata TaxID=7213 RepID=A0A811URD5_CERCA|nr:unnamed protein product [Ceratitis capitata]